MNNLLSKLFTQGGQRRKTAPQKSKEGAYQRKIQQRTQQSRQTQATASTHKAYPQQTNALIERAIEDELLRIVKEDSLFLEVLADRMKLEAEQEKLIEEKRQKSLQFAQKIAVYYNNYAIIAILVVGSIIAGMLIGLNILPEKVTCRQNTANLCQLMNWRF